MRRLSDISPFDIALDKCGRQNRRLFECFTTADYSRQIKGGIIILSESVQIVNHFSYETILITHLWNLSALLNKQMTLQNLGVEHATT